MRQYLQKRRELEGLRRKRADLERYRALRSSPREESSVPEAYNMSAGPIKSGTRYNRPVSMFGISS